MTIRDLWLVALVVLAGCNPLDPFDTDFDAIEDAVLYQATYKTAPPSDPDDVLVMTWNIKFAGGRLRFFFECGGERGWMTEKEVRDNLRLLAEKIKQVDPDIVLLQEADVDSKRTAYLDSVQWLLDHTELNYGAYASQWKADYVPSDGIGRIDSGNAVLSRWPLANAERLAMPLINDQDGLTQYFYLKRNILRTNVRVPNVESFWVVNVHTAAFAEDDTKMEHINLFRSVLDELEQADEQFVAGGDLNAVPPGTDDIKDFPDDNCDDGRFEGDDYSGEEGWLDSLYALYTPAISLAEYQSDSVPHFSFSGDERFFWNRKLDYLFTNEHFAVDSGLVHQSEDQGGLETLSRSDHAPLTAIMVLR